MKKYLLLIFSLLLFLSCIEKKKNEDSKEVPKSQQEDTITLKKPLTKPVVVDENYFRATGTEPFWGLQLQKERLTLNMMQDTIITPLSDPIKVQDSNISMYRVQTEAVHVDVIIALKECTNAMSGEKSSYTVTIAYKYTGEEETFALEGCGNYITDYRLHDIWVLEQMDGKTIAKEDFNGQDVPNMEINQNTNRFSGFSGCNKMTGGIFYEKDVLRFIQVAGTKMACPGLEKESEFLKHLQASTKYSIANNRLILSNDGQDTLLIFKKMD